MHKIKRFPAAILAELERRILIERQSLSVLQEWLQKNGCLISNSQISRYRDKIKAGAWRLAVTVKGPLVSTMGLEDLQKELGDWRYIRHCADKREAELLQEIDKRTAATPAGNAEPSGAPAMPERELVP